MPRSKTQPHACPDDVWKAYTMAIDDVTERLVRITDSFNQAGVEYALIGGQAVALWVATVDPSAVRTTKDVDILLDRQHLAKARHAANSVEMDYFEIMHVGMFLDRSAPNPRSAVHLVWAGEKVRPHEALAAPSVENRITLPGGMVVVSLPKLVEMKLTAFRDQDRVHLRDMMDLGLVDPESVNQLPTELVERYHQLSV